MHGRTRLALHRFCHEGGVDAVLQRRLADGALEQENLIGKLDGVAVAQVDLQLRRAFLVDLEALLFREVIDIVDQLVELVDAGDGIALPADNGAAGPALRRMQRIIRVVIHGDEVEFDFRRDDRLPALFRIKRQHVLQHVARRVGDEIAFRIHDVADHLRGRVALPRHDGERGKIRHQLQVAVARLVTEIRGLIRIFA
ncbi:hypothetical protein D3C72_1394430 [compost metagenome]